MSSDEALTFLFSLVVAVFLWGRWLGQHASLGPPFAVGRKPQRALAFSVPFACAAILYFVLRSAASFDVRDSALYTTFYMVLGAAWVGVGVTVTPVVGISARDDVIERRNGAAATALAGAMIGITFAFAGGNVGDGPGWWVVVFSAGLATLTLYGAWIVFDLATNITDAITIERDDAAGLRLAGFLIAEGIIAGRSAAGNWVSASDTIHDFFMAVWPAVVVLGFAALPERYFRTRPGLPRASVALLGFVPAVSYVLIAVVFVLQLMANS